MVIRNAHKMMQQGPGPVSGAGGGESLSNRLAKDAVPLAAALAWAKDIAKALATLHARGAAHGRVRQASIQLTPRGAVLPPSSGEFQSAAADVAAFGVVLECILGGLEGGSPPALLSRLKELAAKCQREAPVARPSMKKVVLDLRLLELMWRRTNISSGAMAPLPEPAAQPEHPASIEAPAEKAEVPAAAPKQKAAREVGGAKPHRCPNCGGLDTRITRTRPLWHKIVSPRGATCFCHSCRRRFLPGWWPKRAPTKFH